jgi:hypothetical protein
VVDASILRLLVILALLVSGVCLVLSAFRVAFSIPAWVMWGIIFLLCLVVFLGIR